MRRVERAYSVDLHMGQSLNMPATVTTGTELCLAASATMFDPLGAINPPLAWGSGHALRCKYDEWNGIMMRV